MQDYESDDDEQSLNINQLSESICNVEKSLEKIKDSKDNNEEAPPPPSENQMCSS